MSLLERIKGMFERPDLPEKTRRLFESAKSTEELLAGLDEMLTHNEVALREIDREMARLEAVERSESEKVRSGRVDGRSKRNVLYHISRLRKQMDLYEQRARIYRHNIEVHMRLIGRIQEMEAMRLRGVDEQQIEQIAVRFDETRERFEDAMHAAAALDTEVRFGQAREERELAALEAEIMAGAAPPERAPEQPQLAEEPMPPQREERREQTSVRANAPAGFTAVPPPPIEEPKSAPEAEAESEGERVAPSEPARAPRRIELE